MVKKSLNDRCPLQVECERKKCDFVHNELECPYYSANARDGYYIYDQEDIRNRTYREREEADFLASLEGEDDETEPGSHIADSGKMVYLPIEKLIAHPDNPRKELGDLTELADSIKENGVLQNLTVVPRIGEISGQPTGTYTVVIGHRRLAASKLAGLKELPCVVSDMTLRDQVRTMLMENIQRADLTVYEQAQGFQMMLDMGDSVDDIARKSGFSTTTVRRRVKLLELDQEKFKKSEERGVSLYEYMELDKLKSQERKNEMLDYIGTENFKYKLKQAIDAEAAEEKRQAWIDLLSSFATQVDSRNGYRTVKSSYVSNKPDMERPEDADTVEYFFNIEKWGYVALMVRETEKRLSPEEEEAEREEQLKQDRKNADQKALSDATARAYELRADFVVKVSATAIKKNLADIVALWAYAEYRDDTSWLTEEEISQAIGMESHAEEDEDGEDDAELTLQTMTDAISKTPEKVLLQLIYARLGDDKSEGYFRSCRNSYTMKHEENEKLDRIYALLVKLGYEMSDDEKALQNGTHDLFCTGGGEVDPCTICKSAHPTCDECCKACDTRCNAVQECRRESGADE